MRNREGNRRPTSPLSPVLVIAVLPRTPIADILSAAMILQYGPEKRALPFLRSDKQVRIEMYHPARHSAPLVEGQIWRRTPNNTYLVTVGCGGGPLDSSDCGENAPSSAAITAEKLEVNFFWPVKDMLRLANERSAGNSEALPYDLGRMANCAYQLRPDPSDHLNDVVTMIGMVKDTLECRGLNTGLPSPKLIQDAGNRVKIRLVSVIHEAQISQALKEAKGSDILIIEHNPKAKRFTGRYQVLPLNPSSKAHMAEIAYTLRCAEMELRGASAEHIASVEPLLRAGGAPDEPGANLWHLYPRTGQVSNGTKNHCYVDPSELRPTKVLSLVNRLLNPRPEGRPPAAPAEGASILEAAPTHEREPSLV
ncbi:MAG TPA: hypothetical protein VLA04_02680 [Verrucomicrobiae bacterium]|nr:hypothetical protein [Verrucomicrobiae bacterium]